MPIVHTGLQVVYFDDFDDSESFLNHYGLLAADVIEGNDITVALQTPQALMTEVRDLIATGCVTTDDEKTLVTSILTQLERVHPGYLVAVSPSTDSE